MTEFKKLTEEQKDAIADLIAKKVIEETAEQVIPKLAENISRIIVENIAKETAEPEAVPAAADQGETENE